MKPDENYYEILRLAADADQQEITQVFKQALKELPKDPAESSEAALISLNCLGLT